MATPAGAAIPITVFGPLDAAAAICGIVAALIFFNALAVMHSCGLNSFWKQSACDY